MGKGGEKMADISKVKAAVAGRKPKKMSKTSEYMLWIGGTVGLIVAAMIMLVINPDRGPFQIPVNDPHIIDHINRNAKSWRAKGSTFFEGWTIGDAKLLEGVSVSPMGGSVPPCVQPPGIELPESFDARERWPTCFSNPLYHMGNCTASWAIATASALSNRFCIADPGTHGELMLSPQQLLSCDTLNRACEGGDLDTAWNFVEQQGLVSEICFPYQADSSVPCSAQCAGETPLRAASHCMLDTMRAIKQEILQNGPVVGAVFLVNDFLVYKGGLYSEIRTATPLLDRHRQRILQAVKMLGWGSVRNPKGEIKNYWIIENSFGEDWGEHGYARIASDSNEGQQDSILLGSYVLAGTPSSSKIQAALDDDEDVDHLNFEDEDDS